MKRPFLFIALDDFEREKNTLEIAEELSEIVKGNFGFKVNLDYLLKESLQVAIKKIKEFRRPIFVDLKMWNGEITMASVAEKLVSMEIDFFNVYALADEQLSKTIEIVEGTNTKILALTVLSHYSEDYCQKHFRRSFEETVRHFAEVAVEFGCHGIILPGTALHAVQDLKIIKVVPGTRPNWYQDNRHKEVIEPKTAIEKKADALVCGSPIMKYPYPVLALREILAEMKEAKKGQ